MRRSAGPFCTGNCCSCPHAQGIFGSQLGTAYLGTQGDVWDTQRDMALASAGAFIAVLVNAYLRRDFPASSRKACASREG